MKLNLKSSLAATGLALGTTLMMAASASAASLFSFEVTPDFGFLSGQSFSGTVEFDDSLLTGIGDETVSLSSFNFDFLGTVFTEADDNDNDPFAQFFDGVFLGVSFVEDDFQFSPGFFSIDEAFFSYDLPDGAGFGSVAYTPVSVVSVPDPSVIGGLVAVGLVGLKLKRKAQAPAESRA